MTEAEMRLHRCCFTGHRPEKLSWDVKDVCSWLEQEIRKAVLAGFTTFISGMARGVDIWAAQIVLRLKDEGKKIHLICACPYNGFERGWDTSWKECYLDILKRADLVKYISPKYSPDCFQVRNEWMVDHSNRVIAVFNGKPSGTKNTIDYANKNHVGVVFFGHR